MPGLNGVRLAKQAIPACLGVMKDYRNVSPANIVTGNFYKQPAAVQRFNGNGSTATVQQQRFNGNDSTRDSQLSLTVLLSCAVSDDVS